MSNAEVQAIKDRSAIELLVYIMRSTVAKGYDAVTVERLNDVLMLADGAVVDPKSHKELEVIGC